MHPCHCSLLRALLVGCACPGSTSEEVVLRGSSLRVESSFFTHPSSALSWSREHLPTCSAQHAHGLWSWISIFLLHSPLGYRALTSNTHYRSTQVLNLLLCLLPSSREGCLYYSYIASKLSASLSRSPCTESAIPHTDSPWECLQCFICQFLSFFIFFFQYG